MERAEKGNAFQGRNGRNSLQIVKEYGSSKIRKVSGSVAFEYGRVLWEGELKI